MSTSKGLLLAFTLVFAVGAVRTEQRQQLNLESNISGPVGTGIQAVTRYAAGNCQFEPLFDVAHFLMEAAPAAASGVGMLAKPVVTGATVSAAVTGGSAALAGSAVTAVAGYLPAAGGTTAAAAAANAAAAAATNAAAAATSQTVVSGVKVVTMGSRATTIAKFMGIGASMSNPAGIAVNVLNAGLTAYQLYQMQQMLRDPAKVNELVNKMFPQAKGPIWSLPWSAGKVPPPAAPVIPGPPASPPPALPLDSKVALAAGAVLLTASGAVAAWHHMLHTVAFDQAICPSDRWLRDPTLFNRAQQPARKDDDDDEGSSREDDDEDDEDEEDEEIFGVHELPMPRCNQLTWVKVPTVCGDDMECRHRSCQQACCDSKKACTMYQFDAEDPKKCWLGDSTKFNPDGCEQWFGKAIGKYEGEFDPDPRLNSKVEGLERQPDDLVAQTARKVCPGRSASDSCVLLACQEMCVMAAECKLYQIRVGKQQCWLGFDRLSDLEQPNSWYGGVLDPSKTQVGCEEGRKFCPDTRQCVDNCATCTGYSLDSTDDRCMRTAEQAVCDPDSWAEEMDGVLLNSMQCKGLELFVAKMSEETGFNGHAVCERACCDDPSCVLYQVRQSAAHKTHRKAGDKVHCWLGKVDSSSNKKFRCEAPDTGFKLKLDHRRWEGRYLVSRGCPAGRFACLLSNECVQSCAAQCPGAVSQNVENRLCEGSETQILGLGDKPIVTADGQEGDYYLSVVGDDVAAADTLLMVTQNKHRLITSTIGRFNADEVCSTLALGAGSCSAENGGCTCSYGETVGCSTWFKDDKHIRPVVSDLGMVLLAGDKCQCSGSACSFGLLDKVPAIKLDGESDAAFNV